MTGDPDRFDEFLDDYFAESDEHLIAARRALLALEPLAGRADVDRAVLDELFRRFHTIKGLSGMVGIGAAEELAHHLEGYLRLLRDGLAPLTAAGHEALRDGTRALEQVIAARRADRPPPDTAAAIARLAALLPGSPAGADRRPPRPEAAGPVGPPPPDGRWSLAAPSRERLIAAVRGGARAWCFRFEPAPALAERGINVGSVRATLQAHGELIDAAPRIGPDGAVAFEFVLASAQDDAVLLALCGDGLSGWRCDSILSPPAGGPAPGDAAGGGGPASRSGPEGLAWADQSMMPASVVRVTLSRLDSLMHMVGELIITHSRLDDRLRRLEPVMPAADWRSLQDVSHALARQVRALREEVTRTRLMPIGQVFRRMDLIVRDLAREHDRQVVLELSGHDTEIDKFVVEQMLDPLLHLVRNALSHGIEPEAERLARGKSPAGRLSLRAATAGAQVVLEIEDDGRGIDVGGVAARAVAMGLLPAGAKPDPDALLDLIAAPGLSTREEADRTSGRGVGMSVVRGRIEELGGTLSLETWPGLGTRFTVHLPLTLVVVDAFTVGVAGHTYAVPLPAVREIVAVPPPAVTLLENNELLPHHGRALPLLRLARLFGLDAGGVDGRPAYALVVQSDYGLVGLVVDRLLGRREIVVRPLVDPLVRIPGVAGATDLGDGRAVLILDPAALCRLARHRKQPARRRLLSEEV